MVKQAIILCGGEGRRLGSVKGGLSKCLVEVGERPFIYYIIMMLKGMGVDDIVLLTKNKSRQFGLLEDNIVRTSESNQATVAEEILDVPNLQEMFILAQGDQLPIGNWQGFAAQDQPSVGVKIIGRDAGIAILTKTMIETGEIDPMDFKDMKSKLPHYMMLGTLHIGTLAGLQRARSFIDMAVYGQ